VTQRVTARTPTGVVTPDRGAIMRASHKGNVMVRLGTFVVVIACALAGTGCDLLVQRANPRLAKLVASEPTAGRYTTTTFDYDDDGYLLEVEMRLEDYESEDLLQTTTLVFDWDGEEIKEVRTKRVFDGGEGADDIEVKETTTFSYDDGVLVAYEIEREDNSTEGELSYFDNGRMQKHFATTKPDEGDGRTETTSEFGYDNDGAIESVVSKSETFFETEGVEDPDPVRTKTTFTFDDGLLTEVEDDNGDFGETVRELSYTDEGALDEMDTHTEIPDVDGTIDDSWSYDYYSETNFVRSISVDREDVADDDEYTFDYDEGTVTALDITPSVAGIGGLIDLRGKSYVRAEGKNAAARMVLGW
jgi:hypothetical protein